MKNTTQTTIRFFIGFLIGILIFSMFFIPLQANGKTIIKYDSSYARAILRAAAGLERGNADYDLDEDGKVTSADARIALRRAARLTDYAPPTTQTTTTQIPTTTTPPTTQKQYEQIGVLSTCGLTESQLRNGLNGVLKDYADVFLEAEAEYNVNAVFLAAVAALESGWGSSWLAQNKNNLYGWKGNGGYRYFDSKTECIMFVARNLRNTYLTPGGGCFRGYEVEDIERNYCPGGGWASQVRGIMSMIKRNAY